MYIVVKILVASKLTSAIYCEPSDQLTNQQPANYRQYNSQQIASTLRWYEQQFAYYNQANRQLTIENRECRGN